MKLLIIGLALLFSILLISRIEWEHIKNKRIEKRKKKEKSEKINWSEHYGFEEHHFQG